MEIKVDLYSDTVTRPSEKMRQFMAAADVGDEQLGEDPSVNKLNEMTAELLDKEEALYLPSGHMANQIAYAVHCEPGDEIIMDASAHPLHFEGGAAAVISGVSLRPLEGKKGIFSAKQVKNAVRREDYHHPRSRVVSVEQTVNMGGGTIWPLSTIKDVCEHSQKYGLKTHLDGARLFNASAASGISVEKYAAEFDSVWIDLSKGLGAPVGSVLAGSEEFIEKAHFWKQRLGGAMRQAGIIAAGGIYALENNIARLKEDHRRARFFAEEISKLSSISLNSDAVVTNIVIFKINNMPAQKLLERLLAKGVRLSQVDDERLRAVTHLDVNFSDIEYAVEVFNRILG